MATNGGDQTNQLSDCKRPKDWCSHEGAKKGSADCDGDGLSDPTCTEGERTEKFGSLDSSNGCQDSWPNGTCVAWLNEPKAVDGCSSDANIIPKNHPDKAYVRCCDMDGTSCTSYNGSFCTGKKTYYGAQTLCKDMGKRLCNNEEELNMCCGETNCGYDDKLVWIHWEKPDQVEFDAENAKVITNDKKELTEDDPSITKIGNCFMTGVSHYRFNGKIRECPSSVVAFQPHVMTAINFAGLYFIVFFIYWIFNYRRKVKYCQAYFDKRRKAREDIKTDEGTEHIVDDEFVDSFDNILSHRVIFAQSFFLPCFRHLDTYVAAGIISQSMIIPHFLGMSCTPCLWFAICGPAYRAQFRQLMGAKNGQTGEDIMLTLGCPCIGIAQQARVLDKATNVSTGPGLLCCVTNYSDGKLVGKPVVVKKDSPTEAPPTESTA